MRYLLVIFCLVSNLYVIAQKDTAQIYGTVYSTHNTSIAYATVSIINYPKLGTFSNTEGKYSITIPANDSVLVLISYIGYRDEQKWFFAKSNQRVTYNPVLEIEATQIPLVDVVYNLEQEDNVTYLSSKKVTHLTGVSLSGIEGSLKSFSSVSSKSELSSQYSVRGGSYDENLVYVNDVPIFKPKIASSDKQEGLSIINPYMVGSLSFSSGGFGVQYGDKMSSVLDVKYRDVETFQTQFDGSLLDANITTEGFVNKSKSLSYLVGMRYKNTSLLLTSLENKGEYKPLFYDLQSLLNYKITKSSSVSYWFYGANNDFTFVPTKRITDYGGEKQVYRMEVYFDGNEKYSFQNRGNAVTYRYIPNTRTTTNTSLLYYNGNEKESFDVFATYRLGEIIPNQTESLFDKDSSQLLAVGSYLEHGRNELNVTTKEAIHNGKHIFNTFILGWGAQVESSTYTVDFNEWSYIDSANYALPYSETAISLSHAKNTSISHIRNLAAAYLYASKRYTWQGRNKNTLKFSIGDRTTYDDYTNKLLHNPRARILYKPGTKNNIGISFATGVYYQIPEFKELISQNGTFYNNIDAQQSIHYVLGFSSNEIFWGRPFIFNSEIYYKDLKHNIPYIIDNVNTVYFPDLESEGYITGIDTKLNGEFVKGVESWVGISFLQAKEHLVNNDSWIRKPNDQLMNFSMYFQDYLPNSEFVKMNMTFMFGSKLPTAAPDATYNEFDNHSLSTYSRIDLGFLFILIGRENQKNTNKYIKNMMIGAEIFNLTDSRNKISYFWIKDVNNRYYSVPNYLTSRRLNLKLSIKF